MADRENYALAATCRRYNAETVTKIGTVTQYFGGPYFPDKTEVRGSVYRLSAVSRIAFPRLLGRCGSRHRNNVTGPQFLDLMTAASNSRRAGRNDKRPRSWLWRTSESRCADIM
jgi:hypothetical protein